MMIRYGCVLLAMVLFGCKTKEKPPAGILPEAQMVQQITELYIMEDKIIQLGVPTDSAAKVFNIMSDKLANKTGIADSTFRRSFEYYAKDPVKLERIYSALVDSLNLKEQRSSIQAP